MLYFSIPDSLVVRPLNKIFLEAYSTHKEWFYDDFIIETAYGVPANCIWNGSRLMDKEPLYRPKEFKEKVVDFYRSYGIAYRLIFTNYMLKPEHLFDTYANQIANQFDGTNDWVMVSTKMMWEYMKEHYPHLCRSWSTTSHFGKDFEEQITTINKLSEKELVVLPYGFNNRFELIDRLTHPENIEILVDEKCVDDCIHRREHRDNVNRSILYETEDTGCRYSEREKLEGYCGKRRVYRDGLSEYTKRGINHFKLEGRSNPNPPQWLFESLMEFFVRRDCGLQFADYVNTESGKIYNK